MGTFKFPQLADRDWLAREYGEKGRSAQDIADEIGCTMKNVDLRLRQYGIPRRGQGVVVSRRDKTCERCGNAYQPNGPAQKLCDGCWAIKTCERCGQEYTLSVEERRKHRPGRKLCDVCCLAVLGGANTRRAQAAGGTMSRRVHKSGYVEINLGYQLAEVGVPQIGPSGHEVTPVLKGGYVYLGRVKEHRWVMEQVLGRKLRDDEIVHHKNGNRQDNSPGNLEVWLLADNHKGQRPEDLLAHALDVLLRYDPGAAHELLARYGFIPSGEVIELPMLD